MKHLTEKQAGGFYAVHRERPFFKDLVSFMTSGPVMISVLEGENAVAKHRDIMGATDPKKAAKGTIRADYASSIDENAVHGSDSLENAKVEIGYFFRTRAVPAHALKRRAPNSPQSTCSVSTGRHCARTSPGRARRLFAPTRSCSGSTGADSMIFEDMTNISKDLRARLASSS